MVKIIAVHNQKGGVGKTTTTTNVGFELARKGYKVLLADLDPQATLTSALGVTDSEETVFSALQGAVDGKETRLPWIRLQENISLCPSCRKMADAEYLLPVSYTHLRAHETDSYLVCRLLLEKKKTKKKKTKKKKNTHTKKKKTHPNRVKRQIENTSQQI